MVSCMIIFLFHNSLAVFCQQPETEKKGKKRSFNLFENEAPLEITLRFDLSTYFRSKPKEEYLKATITFLPGTPDSIQREIRLKTRGVFRNRYCLFAPIELNFKKVDFGYSDLNKISKLKLVTQCNSGKDKEDYVLREYLAYKLFNVMTDTSFRVRLLTINYIDIKKNRKPLKQFGFFLEPVDFVAERIGSVAVKAENLTQKNIIAPVMDRIAIFNFMIGNYDWSVPGQHNIQIFKPLTADSYSPMIAVPHDFDWTGLVNPVYAIPAENVGTENVRERLFTGVCRKKDVFYKDLDQFCERKDAFYGVINDFQYINQRAKRDITGYLNSFFDQLEGDRSAVLFNLMNTCKNF